MKTLQRYFFNKRLFKQFFMLSAFSSSLGLNISTEAENLVDSNPFDYTYNNSNFIPGYTSYNSLGSYSINSPNYNPNNYESNFESPLQLDFDYLDSDSQDGFTTSPTFYGSGGYGDYSSYYNSKVTKYEVDILNTVLTFLVYNEDSKSIGTIAQLGEKINEVGDRSFKFVLQKNADKLIESLRTDLKKVKDSDVILNFLDNLEKARSSGYRLDDANLNFTVIEPLLKQLVFNNPKAFSDFAYAVLDAFNNAAYNKTINLSEIEPDMPLDYIFRICTDFYNSQIRLENYIARDEFQKFLVERIQADLFLRVQPHLAAASPDATIQGLGVQDDVAFSSFDLVLNNCRSFCKKVAQIEEKPRVSDDATKAALYPEFKFFRSTLELLTSLNNLLLTKPIDIDGKAHGATAFGRWLRVFYDNSKQFGYKDDRTFLEIALDFYALFFGKRLDDLANKDVNFFPSVADFYTKISKVTFGTTLDNFFVDLGGGKTLKINKDMYAKNNMFAYLASEILGSKLFALDDVDAEGDFNSTGVTKGKSFNKSIGRIKKNGAVTYNDKLETFLAKLGLCFGAGDKSKISDLPKDDAIAVMKGFLDNTAAELAKAVGVTDVDLQAFFNPKNLDLLKNSLGIFYDLAVCLDKINVDDAATFNVNYTPFYKALYDALMNLKGEELYNLILLLNKGSIDLLNHVAILDPAKDDMLKLVTPTTVLKKETVKDFVKAEDDTEVLGIDVSYTSGKWLSEFVKSIVFIIETLLKPFFDNFNFGAVDYFSSKGGSIKKLLDNIAPFVQQVGGIYYNDNFSDYATKMNATLNALRKQFFEGVLSGNVAAFNGSFKIDNPVNRLASGNKFFETFGFPIDPRLLADRGLLYYLTLFGFSLNNPKTYPSFINTIPEASFAGFADKAKKVLNFAGGGDLNFRRKLSLFNILRLEVLNKLPCTFGFPSIDFKDDFYIQALNVLSHQSPHYPIYDFEKLSNDFNDDFQKTNSFKLPMDTSATGHVVDNFTVFYGHLISESILNSNTDMTVADYGAGSADYYNKLRNDLTNEKRSPISKNLNAENSFKSDLNFNAQIKKKMDSNDLKFKKLSQDLKLMLKKYNDLVEVCNDLKRRLAHSQNLSDVQLEQLRDLQTRTSSLLQKNDPATVGNANVDEMDSLLDEYYGIEDSLKSLDEDNSIDDLSTDHSLDADSLLQDINSHSLETPTADTLDPIVPTDVLQSNDLDYFNKNNISSYLEPVEPVF